MKDTRLELFNNAKALFCQHGFKETSVSNITKMTGVGVGTFYNFYSSKEQLFIDIFLKENIQLKKMIMGAVDLNGDPVEVLKEITTRIFSGMKENPILKEWYNRDTFHKILEKIDEEQEGSQDFFYHLFMEIIKKWQTEGKMRRDIKSEHILALFNSLSFVDLHNEEIGKEYFPHTMNYLVEFIARGLKG